MKLLLAIFLFFAALLAHADDGSNLWLNPTNAGTFIDGQANSVAADILRQYSNADTVHLSIITGKYGNEGFCIKDKTIMASTQAGLLYGAFAFMRGEKGEQSPFFKYRLLNHWDNLDGTIERGYAGKSIIWPTPHHIKEYAIANASVGINMVVLNNVNASPKVLDKQHLKIVKKIADILRPYNIKVFLSVNFASPMVLGKLKTADPLDKAVCKWWKKKVDEIYRLIPDFGGFLVKANSEGQPGPADFKRSHADGANMLAKALKPHGGFVFWRSFVYGANHKGEDRVKQAVSEFKDLDGKFDDNVILQSKNGPLDFQPREPYAPIFDNMKQTRQAAELQITQEYTGQSRHLVFLATMWQEFFQYVNPQSLVALAGVANIGDDKNWCGHHFSQANWYAFGRLAWNPSLSPEIIAHEWIDATFPTLTTPLKDEITDVMLRSREACVDYMMPLGLHHIFRFDHHLGPEPGGTRDDYPPEWCPVYYHRAAKDGIGVDRTSRGTGATTQYRKPYCDIYDNIDICPENLILWFHRLPWTHPMKSGRNLWQELQFKYQHGVDEVNNFISVWQKAKPYIDQQRWQEVNTRLQWQLMDAQEWHDTCINYFQQFSR